MITAVPSQITFRQILVAFDFSKASAVALAHAKVIARRFGSHVVLAHVCDAVHPIAIPEGGWIESKSAAQAEQQVNAAGVALRSEGFPAKAVNAYGALGQRIRDLAESHHTDLVVLGTHGRRGLDRLFFGSDAEALMRHSNCPVLAVGPSARRPTQKIWAPKSILCATSLNPQAAKVVAFAYRLSQTVGATFALLSVDDPDHMADEEETWRIFEDALAEFMPEEKIGKRQIRSLLAGKSPALNIIDVARTLKPDLIVMGAKASGISATHMAAGVLSQVLADAPCPVLTLSTGQS